MSGRILITGCGVVTPLGLSLEELWTNILERRSAVRRCEGPARFACPIEAALDSTLKVDRCVRMAVQAADHAAAMAKLTKDLRIAVIFGSARGPLGEAEHSAEKISPLTCERTMMVGVSAAVARRLGARGPNFVVSATCASSLHAIGAAMDCLRAGRADVVVAGGAEATLTPRYLAQVATAKLTSGWEGDPAGACRPFDRSRSGTVFGEGAVALVLEREGRGVAPLFEIAGYGAASDAEKMHVGSMDGAGVADAIGQALAEARVAPAEVSYIHAHAPGTKIGDRIEAAAIRRAFGRAAASIPASSTKAQTGHLSGASGALGVAIAGMALRHSLAPATANLDEPGEGCELDHVIGRARAGPLSTAVVTAWGFGGTNAAVVVRKA